MTIQFFEGEIDNIPFAITMINGIFPKWEDGVSLTSEQQSDVLANIKDVIDERRDRREAIQQQRCDEFLAMISNEPRTPEHFIACPDCHGSVDPALLTDHMCVEKRSRMFTQTA